MNNKAIIVNNIGKQYKIGTLHARLHHDTLRDKIVTDFKTISKRLITRTKNIIGSEEFWAIRNVSFEVDEGEVLGVIGSNGAGKSTLLKILCQVTSPTEGKAMLHGRVGSLLEVGTGFNQELTGRENIFLSAAILGMKKAYTDSVIDEIIEFSGIEKFLDTPVKRYSSGMNVRLGFAVAAYLQPEILLIDEVLAVGDVAFQKKCLGKMDDVAASGRTILFVSHNMAAVSKLCTRVIVLQNGSLVFSGSADDAIDYYLSTYGIGTSDTPGIYVNRQNLDSSSSQQIIDIELLDRDEIPLSRISTGDYIRIRLHYQLKEQMPDIGFMIDFFTDKRHKLARLSTEPISGYYIPPQNSGKGYIDCILPCIPFINGDYLIDVTLLQKSRRSIHTVENAICLRIDKTDIYKSGYFVDSQYDGYILLEHSWQIST